MLFHQNFKTVNQFNRIPLFLFLIFSLLPLHKNTMLQLFSLDSLHLISFLSTSDLLPLLKRHPAHACLQVIQVKLLNTFTFLW